MTGGPWIWRWIRWWVYLSFIDNCMEICCGKDISRRVQQLVKVNMKTGENEKIYTKNVVNYVTKQEILEFIQNQHFQSWIRVSQTSKSLCRIVIMIIDWLRSELTHIKVTLQSVLVDEWQLTWVQDKKEDKNEEPQFWSCLNSYSLYKSKSFVEPSLNWWRNCLLWWMDFVMSVSWWKGSAVYIGFK